MVVTRQQVVGASQYECMTKAEQLDQRQTAETESVSLSSFIKYPSNPRNMVQSNSLAIVTSDHPGDDGNINSVDSPLTTCIFDRNNHIRELLTHSTHPSNGFLLESNSVLDNSSVSTEVLKTDRTVADFQGSSEKCDQTVLLDSEHLSEVAISSQVTNSAQPSSLYRISNRSFIASSKATEIAIPTHSLPLNTSSSFGQLQSVFVSGLSSPVTTCGTTLTGTVLATTPQYQIFKVPNSSVACNVGTPVSSISAPTAVPKTRYALIYTPNCLSPAPSQTPSAKGQISSVTHHFVPKTSSPSHSSNVLGHNSSTTHLIVPKTIPAPHQTSSVRGYSSSVTHFIATSSSVSSDAISRGNRFDLVTPGTCPSVRPLSHPPPFRLLSTVLDDAQSPQSSAATNIPQMLHTDINLHAGKSSAEIAQSAVSGTTVIPTHQASSKADATWNEDDEISSQVTWNKESTLRLIHLFKEHRGYLNDHHYKKKSVWEIIAAKLRQDPANSVHYRWNHVENKWKNMTKKYRDCVDSNRRHGTSMKCRFFDEIAAIYDYNPDEAQRVAAEGLRALRLPPQNNVISVAMPLAEDDMRHASSINVNQSTTHHIGTKRDISVQREATAISSSELSETLPVLRKKKKYLQSHVSSVCSKKTLVVDPDLLQKTDMPSSATSNADAKTCDAIITEWKYLVEEKRKQERIKMDRLEKMHREKMVLFQQFLDLLEQS